MHIRDLVSTAYRKRALTATLATAFFAGLVIGNLLPAGHARSMPTVSDFFDDCD